MAEQTAPLLKYPSGEDVHSGDRVLYHGEAGEVEFVARASDPETCWYIEQCGPGCMLLVPNFGRVYVSDTANDEDLAFVSRAMLTP